MSALKRIVLVTSSLGAGGAERVLTTLANAWAEGGTDVRVLVLDRSGPFYALDDKIEVRYLDLSMPARHVLHGLWLNLCRVLALRRAILADKADIVLTFGTETNVLTIAATVGLRCRVVASERCDPKFYPESRVWRGLRRVAYLLANAIVTQTQQAAESLGPWLGDQAVVIPNPVILPRSGGEPHKLSKPYILAAGRLVRQKGFDLLVDAFARLAPDFPTWHLVLLGSGDEFDSLLAQAEALKVGDKVHFLGVVGSPGDFMVEAEIFVLPSRFEGFPNVLGEAMASGLPVIAADCPSGPADIVRNGIDGVLVPPDDVGSLALAMRRLMEERCHRNSLGEAARAVTERFSLKRILAAWESVLAPGAWAAAEGARGASGANAFAGASYPTSVFSLAANLGGRGLVLLVINVVGVLLAYSSHVVVARLLGISEYGTYTLILAVSGVATLASQVGFDSLLTRMVPVYGHTADEPALKRLLIAGVLSTSGIVILLVPLMPIVGALLPAQDGVLPVATLALALLLILSQGWANLLLSALIGAQRQILAKSLSETVRPILFVSAVATLWLLSGNIYVDDVLIANIGVVVSLGAFAGATVWRILNLSGAPGLGISIAEYRGWLGTSVPLLLFFLPQSLIINVDIMLLGMLSGADSSGLYWAAARTATLVAFPLYAMNTLVAPMISRQFVSGGSLNSLLRTATLCALPIALAASVALFLFGESILRIFGPEFERSIVALKVLAVGYVLLTLLGPIDFALTMTSHEGKCAVVMFLGVGLNVLLNVLLIPRFGIEGAAVATVISLILTRASLVVLARHYLDVWIYPFLKMPVIPGKN